MRVDPYTHLLDEAVFRPSPNYDSRPEGWAGVVSLVVIHGISLPPAEFGGEAIVDFFLNRLDHQAHPYFETLVGVQVSSHLLVRRDGEIIQFVPLNQRAWHAGKSVFNGQENCNDFSIGIELEGTDDLPYESEQYRQLAKILNILDQAYPNVQGKLAGHSDVAPGRKTDPGKAFDWNFLEALKS
jgi:N-acetyl-anhydromuramoyl-L-alanine amidase